MLGVAVRGNRALKANDAIRFKCPPFRLCNLTLWLQRRADDLDLGELDAALPEPVLDQMLHGVPALPVSWFLHLGFLSGHSVFSACGGPKIDSRTSPLARSSKAAHDAVPASVAKIDDKPQQQPAKEPQPVLGRQ